MIHLPGGSKQEGARFHLATQNGAQFKSYELFIFGTFYLIFSEHGWLLVTETVESKTTDLGGLLHILREWQKSKAEFV